MGKKYIIELEDENYHQYSDSEPSGYLWRVKGFNALVFDEVGISKLTPYTEPDLEQVRKEGYEEGKKQAKVQAELDVCHDIEKVAKENYKAGLSDAWEAVRKIIHMPEGDLLNIFTECYSAVCTALQVILKYDASEAIEKIRQYEDGKQKINVGDEVGYYGVADEHGNVNYSGVVLEIRKDDYLVLEKDGKTYTLKKNLVMSKTGRHFPEIAAVLKQMRGEQDE